MTFRNVKVYRDLMGANAKWAVKTRALLKEKNVSLLNLIGSPGSGKTLLLEKTVRSLSAKPCRLAGKPAPEAGRVRFAVLEGDVETTRDAERLAKVNCMVSQLLSGGACHLEAKLVHYALRDLPLDDLDMVMVENVGNLVCPAEFDIGEHGKVAILSVTEGEDKPVKYPLLFREAKAVVLTKIDLLPHLNFDITACLAFIRQVNADLSIFQVSALSGKGIQAWIQWLMDLHRSKVRLEGNRSQGSVVGEKRKK